MRKLMLSASMIIWAISACQAQDHEFSFSEHYDLNAPCKLNLSTSDGFIQVHPASDERITVNFIVFKGDQLQKISRQELEEQFEVHVSSGSDMLEIEVRARKKYGWSNWKDGYSISFEALVPANTACYLKTSDGDIRVRGLTGMQKLRTSDGDVFVTDISGEVDAATSDGGVAAREILGKVHLVTSDGSIKAEDIDGDATLSTSDGDIRMRGIAGIMDASTSDGDIDFLDCAGSLKGVTSDGDLRGNLVKINGMLLLTTSDGSIDVTLPAGKGINLKMRGEDVYLSGAEVDGRVEDDNVQGEVFGGGIPVELSTSDGRVNLRFK